MGGNPIKLEDQIRNTIKDSGLATAVIEIFDREIRSRRRKILFKAAFFILALAAGAALTETALRLFFKEQFSVMKDERSLMYRYDRNLGWFPAPNSRERLHASRLITATHNSEGFRDSEFGYTDKPGILFLGDSFVWGYDVEASERFTDKLRARHSEWAIYNCGISGYGTDQEYVLLQQIFDRFKPRVVFLMFCTETDEIDNASNMRYGGYYKPYCAVTGNRLEMKGTPVPQSERAFWAEHESLAQLYLARLFVRIYFKVAGPRVLQNPNPTGPILWDMYKYVRSKGAVFIVGLTRSQPALEQFLTQVKIPYVDLTTPLRYEGFGSHWTPEGHTFVCEKIDLLFSKENAGSPRRNKGER